MNPATLDRRIYDELKLVVERGLATGTLMTSTQIDRQLALFRERFGPDVLRKLDGEALLQLMHGRQNAESRCLAYWLEFKDDDEFAGKALALLAAAQPTCSGFTNAKATARG
jgi:5-methylcytosine-specific restriction protein B